MMAMPCLLLLRLLLMMRRMPVVLPQQVEAVIVAIWRPHDGVDVEFGWLRIGQEHTGVVVELNESHRALHPIIECTILGKSADPAKMHIREMALDLGDKRTEWAFGQYRAAALRLSPDAVHNLRRTIQCSANAAIAANRPGSMMPSFVPASCVPAAR
jgi:hypothetical protein